MVRVCAWAAWRPPTRASAFLAWHWRARWRLPSEDVGLHAALLVPFFVYLFHAGVDWMWESTTVTVFGISVIAVAAAAVSQPEERRAAIPLRAGVAALAVVAFLIQLPGLASVNDTRASQTAFKAGDNATALKQATDAIAAEPWAADAQWYRAVTSGRSADPGHP